MTRTVTERPATKDDHIASRVSSLTGEFQTGELVRVTGQDILNAFEQNGFTTARGQMFRTSANGGIISACLMGQGAINLGISQSSMTFLMRNLGVEATIVNMNDTHRLKYEAMVESMKEHLKGHLNQVFQARGARHLVRKKGAKDFVVVG